MKNGILVAGLLLIATLTLIAVNEKASAEVLVEKAKVSEAVEFDNKFISFMSAGMIPDIVINVDTRFIHKISKEKLHTANTVQDIFPEGVYDDVVASNENRIVHITSEGDVEMAGNGEILSAEQKAMALSLDYSSNFYLESRVKNAKNYSDKVVYFFTVTPEKEAEYKGGDFELRDYLRKESVKETVGIKQGNLRPGRIEFIVNELGDVEQVQLESSSGHENFDNRMLELINDLPENWNPAQNNAGEAVAQKLVLFFGTQGC